MEQNQSKSTSNLFQRVKGKSATLQRALTGGDSSWFMGPMREKNLFLGSLTTNPRQRRHNRCSATVSNSSPALIKIVARYREFACNP